MKLFNPAVRTRAHAALDSCLRAELSDAAMILILFALVFGPIIGLHLALASSGPATPGDAPGWVAQGTSHHGPRG
jgi:hypothetical protein